MRLAAFAALVMVLPAGAAAQDFGVMNSAETINTGNFKLSGYPLIVFGKDNADNDTGVAVTGGYGFTDRFDVEAKVAIFDGLTYLGADAEYWVVKGEAVDFSVAGGLHLGNGDGFDTTGFDLTFLASGHIAERLELYGALDVGRKSINDTSIDFTTVHLVPGIEYRVSSKVDFVAEVGLALNDDSSHYLAVGLAFYFGTR
jgi:hypothetical protein